MKYCRYCAFCINGDGYYCTRHDKELSRVDRVTSCPEFAMSELGDVDTGKPYRGREPHEVNNGISQQMMLEE